MVLLSRPATALARRFFVNYNNFKSVFHVKNFLSKSSISGPIKFQSLLLFRVLTIFFLLLDSLNIFCFVEHCRKEMFTVNITAFVVIGVIPQTHTWSCNDLTDFLFIPYALLYHCSHVKYRK